VKDVASDALYSDDAVSLIGDSQKMSTVTGSRKAFRRRCSCAVWSLLLVGTLLTGSSVGSDVINLGVILPFDGADPWSLRLVSPAVEYAVEWVERRRPAQSVEHRVTSVSLRHHAVNIHVNDSRCSDTWGPLSAFDMYLSGRANVFLGPVCEYAVAAVARYSPHWDIPVITAGALVLDFDNRANYRLLTRIAGSYSKLAESLSALLRRFSWRPTAVGLVYQQRARKTSSSRSTLGHSDCFFVMQAVHAYLEALRRPSAVAATNASSNGADIWYRSIKRDALDAEMKLREIALHARSKSSPVRQDT